MSKFKERALIIWGLCAGSLIFWSFVHAAVFSERLEYAQKAPQPEATECER